MDMDMAMDSDMDLDWEKTRTWVRMRTIQLKNDSAQISLSTESKCNVSREKNCFGVKMNGWDPLKQYVLWHL